MKRFRNPKIKKRFIRKRNAKQRQRARDLKDMLKKIDEEVIFREERNEALDK